MPNPFVHIELSTTDINKAKDFYGKLLNWKLVDSDMGGGMMYTVINDGDKPIGGMMAQAQKGAPSAWLAYIGVDDVKASTAKAKSLGANVFVESTEIPNIGSFTIMADPTGAPIALFQAAPRQTK